MTNKVQDIVSLDVTKITASNVVDHSKVQSIKPSTGNVLPTHYVPVVSVISGSNLDEKDGYQQGMTNQKYKNDNLALIITEIYLLLNVILI